MTHYFLRKNLTMRFRFPSLIACDYIFPMFKLQGIDRNPEGWWPKGAGAAAGHLAIGFLGVRPDIRGAESKRTEEESGGDSRQVIAGQNQGWGVRHQGSKLSGAKGSQVMSAEGSIVLGNLGKHKQKKGGKNWQLFINILTKMLVQIFLVFCSLQNCILVPRKPPCCQ